MKMSSENKQEVDMSRVCRDCDGIEFIREVTIVAEARCDANGKFLEWTTFDAGLERAEFSEITECANCGSENIMKQPAVMTDKEFIKAGGNVCPKCGAADIETLNVYVESDTLTTVSMQCENCTFLYEKRFELSGWKMRDHE